MKIAILDTENARVIVAEVPQYLQDADASSDTIAEAILHALGLSSGSVEYMIGDLKVQVDHAVRNDNGAMHKLEELAQDFKEDALSALEELKSN